MLSMALSCFTLLSMTSAQNPPQNPSQKTSQHIDSIVVSPAKLADGIEPQSGDLLSEVLMSELQRFIPSGVKLIGASDIRALLETDKTRVALGCEDSGCLVEIGQAMGASHLLQLSMGRLGTQYAVNAKLISVADTLVVFRDVQYAAANQTGLIKAVRRLVVNMAAAQGWKAKFRASPLGQEPQAKTQNATHSNLLFGAGLGIALLGSIASAALSYGTYWAWQRTIPRNGAPGALTKEDLQNTGQLGLAMGAGAVLSAALSATGLALALTATGESTEKSALATTEEAP